MNILNSIIGLEKFKIGIIDRRLIFMSSISDEEKKRIKEKTKIEMEAMKEYDREQQMKVFKWMLPIIIIVFGAIFYYLYTIL
ncbi:MAG: hypothetical protein ACXAD7_00415 [Candidatus Kariarchaeaceae archaeon]